MNSDLPFCQPGPSTSRVENHQQSNTNDGIQFPNYHYAATGPSTSSVQLSYSLPISSWTESQNFPTYMPIAVNTTQPSPYIYPQATSLILPPTNQIPPTCLDWTINPTNAPHRQYKTTSEPLFTLGYSSTISESWMEEGKGLQYSIKNFTFSTKRTRNSNQANNPCQVIEYDSLIVSIPQVLYLLMLETLYE